MSFSLFCRFCFKGFYDCGQRKACENAHRNGRKEREESVIYTNLVS